MHTFLALFEIGALGFWLLFAFLSLVVVTAINTQKFIVSTLLTLLFFGGYSSTLVKQDWSLRNLGAAFLLYLLIGAFYSIYRWARYVSNEAFDFKNKEGDYSSRYDENDRIATFKSVINVRNNKVRITAWIAWWFWDLAWSLTGGIFTWIYESIKGVYQSISDRALAGVGIKVGKQ